VRFSRYRFTGKERDAESGLDYFGARYYSSSMGRFLSPDWSARSSLYRTQSWIIRRASTNSYVGNNPLKRMDDDGHTWKEFAAYWESKSDICLEFVEECSDANVQRV
jgi:RHS repeat-associated protein